MGLQNYKRTRWHDDDALLFSWMVAFSSRNPRFYFVHARIAGTKPRFLTKMRHPKSGIPCYGCVCIGVKYLQDGFTKLQKHAMTWRRCVAVFYGWLRLYRGKIFARWVYKTTNARDDMTTMRCFFWTDAFVSFKNILDGCVCIGVKYLQDGFTKLQTHAMTWRVIDDDALLFFWMVAFV